MNNKKALFFDIDGTLFYGRERRILPSTIYALEQLNKDESFDLYLSTGRSFDTLGTMKKYVHYFKGLNLTNGQEIYINQKRIYTGALDKKAVEKLLQISEELNTPLGLITPDEVIMNFCTPESFNNFTTYIKADVKNLDHKPFDLNLDVMQIWLFATNDEIPVIAKRVPELSFVNWGKYGADVIPLNASKANGIELIKSKYGYKTCNMYAFGDGDNDAKMFDVVGTSVAMGNGSLLAKSHASFITDKINEDGLYNALVKLGFIKEASIAERRTWK